jgi:UDP-N-acetylmuramoylalanine--D-glutamate ligase
VPIVAVTGTNGKSTTVRLIEAMLRAADLRAAAAGNVGEPALALPGQALDVAVMEVSSFQLETTEAFRPAVSVVLNLSPDHLDRHANLAAYAAAKRRILARQQRSDAAILNFDDAAVRAFADDCPAEVIPFSTRPASDFAGFERAVWLDAGSVVLRGPDGVRRVSLDSDRIAGHHHRENLVAALAAVWALGVDVDAALTALIDFRGLPHRCEIVAEIDGVTWVDDSKATNPGAAQMSLRGFGRPIHWIAGGRDKGLSFEALADTASGRVARALLIGEAAPLIEAALAGRVPCELSGTLDVAVTRAAATTRRGDVVLLAPACASFDQFESFEERGDRFRHAVEAIARGGAS